MSVVAPGSEQAHLPCKCKASAAITRHHSCTNTKLRSHEHEIILTRTQNCFRTNTKFSSHEREINPARTRNETRIAARTPARNCPHEIFMRMFQAVSGFGGRSQARLSARKQVRGINFGAFSCGHSGRQLWGHFVRAISRGQFRAGNFAQAISRPCVVLPAARARRLPLASRVVFAAATTLIGHNAANADGRSADGSCACGNDEKGTWSNGTDGRAARGVRPAVPHMTNQTKSPGAPGQFRWPFRPLLCP